MIDSALYTWGTIEGITWGTIEGIVTRRKCIYYLLLYKYMRKFVYFNKHMPMNI